MSRIFTADFAEIMTYIHERSDWPHLRWDETRFSVRLAEVRHRQGRLVGRMESLGFRMRNETVLDTLSLEVVKSSAIEGERLDAGQVRSSIARRLGLDFGVTTAATRAVDGVVEMMLDATRHFRLPLTAERLFGWHAALFPAGRSGSRKITVGAWRPAEAGAMQVVSGPIGRERVHFEAPSADRLDREMNAFLDWFESSDPLDPVLKAAVAHFWFVTIHPFEDGNGRIARAIAALALARADGTPERFYSMSAQIEAERHDYYANLESSQRGGTNITAWIEWFLPCLDRALGKAEEGVAAILRKSQVWEQVSAFPLNERQRKVLNRLLDGFTGKLSTSKYAKLAKCSPDTALRDIQALVAHGVLAREEGGGRSTSYRLAG